MNNFEKYGPVLYWVGLVAAVAFFTGGGWVMFFRFGIALFLIGYVLVAALSIGSEFD